jgi:hypothetical protein
VLVVEQPVHRDQALSDTAALSLREWKTRPPIIIDESDGAVGDLPRALELGYAGTSYKNCKGIVKGISNACLLENKRRQGDRAVLTGEDLCTLGPIVLLQDLAMMSLLGVEHVERNGHHYYRGLSMFPNSWQETMLEQHSSLYERDSGGFARLQVRQGEVCLDSINRAPFGVLPLFDPGVFSRI